MKIFALTRDKSVIELINKNYSSDNVEIEISDRTTDPLEVISNVHSTNSDIIILDDDMLNPNSARILKSIKQITNNNKVIFITSDNSLELGRKISPIGVYYYGIKPISKELLSELINSFDLKNKSITH